MNNILYYPYKDRKVAIPPVRLLALMAVHTTNFVGDCRRIRSRVAAHAHRHPNASAIGPKPRLTTPKMRRCYHPYLWHCSAFLIALGSKGLLGGQKASFFAWHMGSYALTIELFETFLWNCGSCSNLSCSSYISLSDGCCTTHNLGGSRCDIRDYPYRRRH